ncbi:thiosulfate oxidation carrier protein SoxY [Sulfurovum sp. bin170]|uniref:thiosulfate oxidation carrier protein SoxY n=1 Tax=Sulfurovum sp. bin170 TaxID=2695268 RepID=UPI00165F9E4B|nr:thiosulfate oxidation carrier protein SoxY [Sulfurovum sp. bin170]
MNRRKFLGLGLAAVALAPTAVSAIDFRKTKPDTWTADDVESGIEALYGAKPTASDKITLKAPKVASNGGAIPVTIRTDIEAKSVAIFQDANPESAVAVFTVPEGGIVDYSVKIKMKASGKVTVIVEDKAGKLHSAEQEIEVALGGCEG